MKAIQTEVRKILSTNVQYRVPLYQRHYQWSKHQWNALFRDVVNLAGDRLQNPSETHFLGSIVLATPPDGGRGLLVVDGQQRLVTYSLLLCALRDEFDLPADVVNSIDACLHRRDDMGKLLPPFKRLKVLPTQADLHAFACIVDGETPEQGSSVVNCYRHFRTLLAQLWENSLEDDEVVGEVGILETTSALLRGITCVSITAGKDDNAHRIFESLNNTGMPLTQSDLLRNYVFMRLDEKSEDFFIYSWQPLENRFDPKEFTQLFWLDLIMRGISVNQSQTYVYQQKYMENVSKTGIRDRIESLSDMAESWEKVLRPELETSAKIRRRLRRIAEWRTTTAAPTLMYLMEERRIGNASVAETARAMLFLESYFVRRVTVGRATMNMNRILMAAPAEMAKRSVTVDEALRIHLSGEGKYWASDDEVREAAIAKPFYRHGRARQKTLILRWIEESLRDHEDELDPALTVEHIMPRHKTSEWLAEIKRTAGVSPTRAKELHAQLVDTLGNLTLAGQSKNSRMSDKSFADKKAVLRKMGSGMQLTSEVVNKHHWGPHEIRDRSSTMAERIITIWPGPMNG